MGAFMFRTVSITYLTIALLTSGCGDDGGTVIANTANLLSSTLASSRTIERATCSASATTCTPTNMTGRAFAAGAMLGELGPTAYSMTFLANSDDIIENPSQSSHPEGTLTFDLGTTTQFSGKISIPAEDNMPPSKIITRVEVLFDYLDTKFTLTGTNSGGGQYDGEYTLRTVFRKTATATDVGGGSSPMQWGDVLVKLPGESEWKWCDSTGCSTTRPTSPHQMTEVASAAANPPAEGNPNYVSYAIDLSETLNVTYAQISSTTNQWTIDFNLSNAVAFDAAPSSFTSSQAVVDNFNLLYACGFNGCSGVSDGIKATLSIAAASR